MESLAIRRPSRHELGALIGMMIALGVFAMCFAGLFFAYAVVRAQAGSWPHRLPLALPAFNTALLLASSFAIARRKLALTALLGIAFLGLQTVVWVQQAKSGLLWNGTQQGSVFYALTWFHALHVIASLIAIACVRGKAGRARLAALFWHFVDAVWVVTFLTVYVF